MSLETERGVGTYLLGLRVEELVGRGGMGVVYRAWDDRLKRSVAVKLVAPELSEDPDFRERFRVESQLAASLEHPNVVPVYDAGEVEGRLAIVMRFVEGTDLRRLLAAEGPLDPARATTICAQVADALDAAHERGLVHRDVKPSNVLLDQRERAYLADFGLSGQLAALGEGAGRSVGTAAYASPEQIRGEPVDQRADVYALGCLLYECLTGETAYPRERELAVLWAHLEDEPPNASERNPALSAAVDSVLARALAKDPAQRYATCDELIEGAREALGLRDAAVRSRKPLLLAVIVTTLALAAALAALLLGRGDTAPATPSTKPTLTPTGDSLQHINPNTNELVATTRLGPRASHVAVGEGAVWVLDQELGRISRIDPETGSVTLTSGAGLEPIDLAAGAGSAWVLGHHGTIGRLNRRTLNVAEIYENKDFVAGPLAAEGAIWASTPGVLLRLGPDGILARFARVPTNHLLLLLAGGGGSIWTVGNVGGLAVPSLMRLDARRGTVVARIALDFTPTDIAANGDGAWVVDRGGDRVLKVSLETNRITATIPVGNDPFAIAAGGDAVWVANLGDGTVSRIDSRTNEVVATTHVGPRPSAIAADDGGVWVIVHSR